MDRIVKTLLGVALLLSIADLTQARNKYPPGPPYRNCPDSLRIYSIEQTDTLLAPCHPAPLDTVLGVGGIITAFDAKPSEFAIYLQSSGGGPFSGVQAFTGAYNYNNSPFNLALGDSIVVYGTTQEFPAVNGTTEIEGPDVISSTNDILIRKVSSGNPLPPFRIVTTSEMNWVPGSTQEQWEGCLVRLRGPMHVGRNSLQNGRPTLPFNSFLVVKNSSPADSVLIDGNSLTTFSPPSVNAAVDSVQGVVNENTTSGVLSYRVQIRNSADIALSVPPNLTDAYAIDANLVAAGSNRSLATSNVTLRLEFDRDVDVTSAENESNYHLGSGISGSTVDLATVEGGAGRFVRLQITSLLAAGDLESITTSGIAAANCPTCPSSQQSRTFINGVLDLKTVQAPDPAYLNPCDDRSRFAGTGLLAGARISVRGVGVGQFGSLQYLEDADGGNRGGLSVFGPSAPLSVGRRYLIAGNVQEFGGETELVNNVYLLDLGSVTPPAPREDKSIRVLTDTTCDASRNRDTGEDWEGMLVKLHDLRVAERGTISQSWYAAGPCCTFPDTILVSNLNGVLNSYVPPDSGSIVDVTGILHFASGTFRICPRNASDIVVKTNAVPNERPLDISFRIAPNPARATRVDFTLPRAADVELRVYDLFGREVALLARGRLPAGAHSKQWDGRDASGRSVASGVYFFRLAVGGEKFSLRGVKLE